MTKVRALNQLYAASAAVAREGVEIIAVGDPVGARFNRAVQRLAQAVREDGSDAFDDLTGAAKALRWRAVTQPQPVASNLALIDGAQRVGQQVRRLRGSVADEQLLDELEAAALSMAASDPVLGQVLLQSLGEVGPAECVVVAASVAARNAVEAWLGNLGTVVLTAGDLERQRPRGTQLYVIGPAVFFKPSLVTAPVIGTISFLTPAWFADRSIPSSPFALHAEGAIRVRARVFEEGDTSQESTETIDPETAEEFQPQVKWGRRKSPDREPGPDEVEAHKVVLNGGLAMWLDDGDRIRALEPAQPVGERVLYTDVQLVRAGTYLLLRVGENERGVLYDEALRLLGERSATIAATQHAWKARLTERLMVMGNNEVVRQLRGLGVKAASQARAWRDPSLIRPNRDQDCESLFTWLDVPIEPTLANATSLRRALYQASAGIREELETTVSGADLSRLERDGSLSIGARAGGFREIVATRVIAISPLSEIVARYEARVPFEDSSAQWLE